MNNSNDYCNYKYIRDQKLGHGGTFRVLNKMKMNSSVTTVKYYKTNKI